MMSAEAQGKGTWGEEDGVRYLHRDIVDIDGIMMDFR